MGLGASTYLILKYLHVLGAIVVLGTGAGIAFFMLMADRSRDTAFIARTAGVVVLADTVFTATSILAQPVTGYLLLRQTGVRLGEPWIVASLALYAVAGAFWLPVVWMQPAPPSPPRRPCRRAIIACSGSGSRSASRASAR